MATLGLPSLFDVRTTGETDVRRVGQATFFLLAFGLLLTLIGKHAAPALWAMAALALGGTVGFLFGIPRVSQSEVDEASGPGSGAEPAGGEASKGKTSYRQRVNTNLEQISDWLTKMSGSLS